MGCGFKAEFNIRLRKEAVLTIQTAPSCTGTRKLVRSDTDKPEKRVILICVKSTDFKL